MPCATITQTVPRRLHSMHTLCVGMFGRRLVQEGADHLEQLPLVDRAAVQLEVDRHVRARSASRSSSVEMYSGEA